MNSAIYKLLTERAKTHSNNLNYCKTAQGYKDYLTIKQDLFWIYGYTK
jgi:hypothetical protein